MMLYSSFTCIFFSRFHLCIHYLNHFVCLKRIIIFSTFLNFSATPRVTTTLIPLNVCPTEYYQTVKPTSTPVINIIENVQEQNKFENKSKGIITTHLIGDWIIRESSEPFQRKEKERLTAIEK